MALNFSFIRRVLSDIPNLHCSIIKCCSKVVWKMRTKLLYYKLVENWNSYLNISHCFRLSIKCYLAVYMVSNILFFSWIVYVSTHNFMVPSCEPLRRVKAWSVCQASLFTVLAWSAITFSCFWATGLCIKENKEEFYLEIFHITTEPLVAAVAIIFLFSSNENECKIEQTL